MGRPVRDTVEVTLRALREDELGAFIERGRAEYRRQLVEFAGLDEDAADRKAEKDFVPAPTHSLYALEEGERVVGTLWLAERGEYAWLFEIWLDPAERGRGVGRAAMLALEDEVRRRGLRGVELNVWGGNDVARSLYRSLGYGEQSVSMRKDL